MRGLLLSVAMAAGVTMAMAATAQAQPVPAVAQRLANQMDRLDRINEGRPRGEVQRLIAHSIDVVRARVRDIYSGRVPVGQTLAEIDDSLHAIAQYSYNGSDIAPFQDSQTAPLVARLRQELAEAQVALSGGYGQGGYGQGGWQNHGGGRGYGYAPAPAQAPPYVGPRYAPTTYAPAPVRTTYVPPPAPARYYR